MLLEAAQHLNWPDAVALVTVALVGAFVFWVAFR